ncbi:hypothetical protein ACS0TY_017837 [Phlomoides rotata]
MSSKRGWLRNLAAKVLGLITYGESCDGSAVRGLASESRFCAGQARGAGVAAEKTEEELRKEIDELHRQQRKGDSPRWPIGCRTSQLCRQWRPSAWLHSTEEDSEKS